MQVPKGERGGGGGGEAGQEAEGQSQGCQELSLHKVHR